MALENIIPATREEEFLDRIARAAAAPNLPEVDASDNGKILSVVSGEWAAAAVTAANIPAPPEALGNYYLEVSVDIDGIPTYRWIEV